MTLTIVFDRWTEKTAIYIDGMLRAEADAGEFDQVVLMECYDTFAHGQAVMLERVETDTRDEDYEFPEQLGEALKTVVGAQ